MANVIPGVPPTYNGEDLRGTVKSLCNYMRTFQENVDFILSQIKKNGTYEEIEETFEEIEGKLEEQEIQIKALQDSLAVLEGE